MFSCVCRGNDLFPIDVSLCFSNTAAGTYEF